MVLFFAVETPEETSDREYYERAHRTPNCYRCGRFCRILNEYRAFDGQGTNLYITFDCKHCGKYTESMW